MVEATTLTEAITSAVEAQEKPLEKAKEIAETKETTEKTETTETGLGDTEKKEVTETVDASMGLTEMEQQQARQLFAALKNPEHSKTVIEFLAKQAGIGQVETKKEAEVIKEDIVSVLKEKLGPDLDYLAEKLGPVIEKVVDDKVKTNTADLRAKQEASDQKKLADEASAAMGKLAKSQFNKDELPDDVLTEMNKLMDKISPSANMSVSDYIEFVYHAVAGKKGIKAVDASQEERRSRNRTDAPSRLASEGKKEPVANTEAVAKFTTLDAAVKAAVEALASQEK